MFCSHDRVFRVPPISLAVFALALSIARADDCNNNGVEDADDITNGTSLDCNANLVPDECDIAGGVSGDDNGSAVPDECELAILPGNDVCIGGSTAGAPCSNDSDCAGGRCYTKNRFISATPTNSGPGVLFSAIRVTVIDIPANLPSQQTLMEGDIWWAGAPFVAPEGPPGGSFKVAPLECAIMPHLRDWSAEGLIHLYGPAIIPGSIYEIRACSPSMACSEPLVVQTARFGDCTPPLGAGQPNWIDMSSMVDKFKGTPGSRSKTRTQLQPNVLNLANNVGFLDISENVSAFKGFLYPFPGASCP